MRLQPGQTLRSVVDDTRLMVVRGTDDDVDLLCGGVGMTVDPDPGAPAPASVTGAGVVLGKRYAPDGLGIELLCVKGGSHPVTLNGSVLPAQAAKPLPASD